MTKDDNSESGKPGADGSMPLLDHLRELRKRTVWSFYFFLAWFLVCYAFRYEMVAFLKKPIEEPLAKYSVSQPAEETPAESPLGPGALSCSCVPAEGSGAVDPAVLAESSGDVRLQCHCEKAEAPKKSSGSLVFLSIPEVFISELKASFFMSFFLSLPFMLVQIGIFVFPALYKKSEKAIFWYFSIGGYIFFLLGSVFGYYFVFPVGFEFFLSLARPGEIMPSISLANYLSFAMMMLFSFGLVFELPLVVFVLAKFGLVTPKMLIRNFRFVLVGILVASAILTPPDPFSMGMMAVPLILLYFLGIFFALFARPKDKKTADSGNGE